MKKNQPIILRGILGLCMVLVVVLILRRPTTLPDLNPLVTKSNIATVEIGMSKEQIESILGEPWKVKQIDATGDVISLNGVAVHAIYEWHSGTEENPMKLEVGFKDGKALVLNPSDNE